MHRVLLAVLCAVALSACTPFVPVKGDYSKKERLHAVVDHKIGVREEYRTQLLATLDPDKRQAIIQSIVDINLEISNLRKEMGYPVSVEPVMPLGVTPTQATAPRPTAHAKPSAAASCDCSAGSKLASA